MKRASDSVDLEKIRREAKKAWDELFSADTLVCTGMSTCGISALACQTQDAIKEELLGRDFPARFMKVGCMGLCYAEPLVYVKKIGMPMVCYGYVTPEVVPSLVDKAILGDDLWKERALGIVDLPDIKEQSAQTDIPSIWDHPMLKPQIRIALRNCGIIDPESIDHYLARGGYSALAKTLITKPEAIIEEVKRSGLRGRGGAGFPTGMKWEFCRKATAPEKYLICNADEGDPGAFMDRSVLEGDPHSVLEGMLIAAHAIGSTAGIIYCRAEYPLALQRLDIALRQARDYGLLGDDILGSGMDFDITIKEGAGAFVCGEETALMASIEGHRGMPKTRPPFPANAGLWSKPTNINNVETFANLSAIINRGGDWYNSIGIGRSKGTKTLSLAGAVRRAGLIEVPMGITLREIIFDIGGGIPGDRVCKGVLTGGPSGGCIPAAHLDTPVDYESLAKVGSIMGSGSMIIIDEGTCIVDLARFFLTFTQRESCGKCTPCRIGTRQMLGILEKITRGEADLSDLSKLERLANAVRNGSLCGLGSTAPNPVLTTLRFFKSEFEEHILRGNCPSLVCKDLTSFYIDPGSCRSCGICAESCPAEAITGQCKEAHVIDQDKCIRCGVCISVCPEKFSAITRKSGKKVVQCI
ncbi:MAG: NADH-quinone oxidoreductase subunit NuoF [Methanotrichaceae archaeon]|jgi:NADH:ubiquinone oxidoreductase subunit F (NADH-binding)/(2Fe-2S) ferredoxin/ferredoxin